MILTILRFTVFYSLKDKLFQVSIRTAINTLTVNVFPGHDTRRSEVSPPYVFTVQVLRK